jgi:hypothetical protein
MDYLKKGWIKSWNAIKSKKRLFLKIFLLQLILVVAFFYISVNYQIKIFNDLDDFSGMLEGANYNTEELKSGEIFSEDTYLIYKSYQSFMNNIQWMIIWLGLIFILLQSKIWILTVWLLEKEKYPLKFMFKQSLKMWIKFISASIIFMGPLMIGFYLIFKNILSLGLSIESFSTLSNVGFYLFLVLYYLMLVSYSQIYLKSWKQFVKSIFTISIKKIHYCLVILLINSILIFIPLLIIYLISSMQELFWLSFTLTLILMFILVWTRLFWIASINSIEKK